MRLHRVYFSFFFVLAVTPLFLYGNEIDEVLTIAQVLRDGYNRTGEEIQVWGEVSDIRLSDSGEVIDFTLRDGRYQARVHFSGGVSNNLFRNGDRVVVRFELTAYRDNTNTIDLGEWGDTFNPEYNLVTVDADPPTTWNVTERREMPSNISVETYVLDAYRYGNQLVELTGTVRSREFNKIPFGSERQLYIQFSSPGQSVDARFWSRYWPEDWEEEEIENEIRAGSSISVTGHFSEETSMGSSFLATDLEMMNE